LKRYARVDDRPDGSDDSLAGVRQRLQTRRCIGATFVDRGGDALEYLASTVERAIPGC
jgi:hypothetical protein